VCIAPAVCGMPPGAQGIQVRTRAQHGHLSRPCIETGMRVAIDMVTTTRWAAAGNASRGGRSQAQEAGR
jgi:hypothetical protein